MCHSNTKRAARHRFRLFCFRARSLSRPERYHFPDCRHAWRRKRDFSFLTVTQSEDIKKINFAECFRCWVRSTRGDNEKNIPSPASLCAVNFHDNTQIRTGKRSLRMIHTSSHEYLLRLAPFRLSSDAMSESFAGKFFSRTNQQRSRRNSLCST